MKNKQRATEMNAINQLCVHTYLQILGYPVSDRIGGRIRYRSPVPGTSYLFVSYHQNQFQCGAHRGGVLDLAALINGTTRKDIFQHQKMYRIDQLIARCGSHSGPLWEPRDTL